MRYSATQRVLKGMSDRVKGYLTDARWALSRGPGWKVNSDTAAMYPDRSLLEHWSEHGWVLLKKSVSEEAVRKLNDSIRVFREKRRGGYDEYGHGMRVGLLHVANRSSLRVAMNPQVIGFLKTIWEDDPVLFGSLTFDIGSEQEPHIDAAFFYTRPEDAMVGVWTALEDIHEDSGPLFYIDRSHRLPRLYASEVLEAHKGLREEVGNMEKAVDLQLSDRVYSAYSAYLADRIEHMSLKKVPALIEKGDVFIWHGWTVHGGLPRTDRRLSRKSMVAHFMGSNATFWNQHEFFLRGKSLDKKRAQKFRYRYYGNHRYVKYDDAVTFESGDGHFEA